MPTVLLATDADWIHEEVDAAIAGDDVQVLRVSSGADVLPVVREIEPDLVICDMQIGNMGAIAVTTELRHDESIGRLPHVQVLILLDRDVDVFLAERADADGWIVKPLNAFRLRRAVATLLQGGRWTEARPAEDASL